jgi:tetraacyldisaccharide 4'-kinase
MEGMDLPLYAPSIPTPAVRLPARPMNGIRQRYLSLIRGETRGIWPALQRFGLRAASVPYGVAVRLRNLGYQRGWQRSQRAAVPVVSVGNLTVGGTGKTPCVESVARFYRGLELRVAILSRGYGSTGGHNDEALVLEENLPDVPHLQGADRVELAHTAVEELESEVLVLDDGFQHRRLARDLDVVLIDATNPWGYGYLLPRGLLREPPSGLKRAGVVVLTRCDQAGPDALERLRQQVGRLAPGVLVVETHHRPVGLVNSDGDAASLDLLRGKEIAAFCGIGNPDAFRRTLEDLGAMVSAFRAYDDHHPYTHADVDDLHDWVRNLLGGAPVVTTQKDLVKLRLAHLAGHDLWAVQIDLYIATGRAEFERRLRAVMDDHSTEHSMEDTAS